MMLLALASALPPTALWGRERGAWLARRVPSAGREWSARRPESGVGDAAWPRPASTPLPTPPASSFGPVPPRLLAYPPRGVQQALTPSVARRRQQQEGRGRPPRLSPEGPRSSHPPAWPYFPGLLGRPPSSLDPHRGNASPADSAPRWGPASPWLRDRAASPWEQSRSPPPPEPARAPPLLSLIHI